MAKKPTETTISAETGENVENVENVVNADPALSYPSDLAVVASSPAFYQSTDEAVLSGAYLKSSDGMLLKVKKRVAYPVLPFLENMTIVCRFIDNIHVGKVISADTVGKAKKEPAMVATIMALNGEHRTLICGAVLRKELEEAYPSDGYVGAWFHITKLPMKTSKDGNNYSTFVINEIEPPSAQEIAAQGQRMLAAAA